MIFNLEELLEKIIGIDKLVIFNEEENIEDKYELNEIPEDWLNEIVKDFEFTFGTLWVKI